MALARPRQPISGPSLILVYLGTAAAAVAAGGVAAAIGVTLLSATKLGCRRVTSGDVPPGGDWDCPDGTGLVIPALLFGAAGALVVVAVAAVLVSRGSDEPTITRVARHLLWLAFGWVAVPGLLWATLLALGSGGGLRPLLGLGAALVGAAPLMTSYVRPSRTPVVLAACLLLPLVVLVLGTRALLALPVAVPLLGLWLISLLMWLRPPMIKASFKSLERLQGRPDHGTWGA